RELLLAGIALGGSIGSASILPRRSGQGVGLVGEGLQQLVEGLGERVHPFVLQHRRDVGEVDADVLELSEDRRRTVGVTVPWSSSASMVCDGMVFTVSGPMRESTYSRSGYAGFLVDVDAHSGRCTLAPFAASASHRGPANALTKCWYAICAWATAAFPRRARIAWSPPSPPGVPPAAPAPPSAPPA